LSHARVGALGRRHRGRRSEPATGVIFVDIDGFKLVNDSLGHAAGDQLLTIVGSRLISVVRGGGRVSGASEADEFLVVCAVDSTDTALQVADGWPTRSTTPFHVYGNEV
jgi:diguanylate cyclase (GGDEF)-like protein